MKYRDFEFYKDFRKNNQLCKSFNDLSKKTFQLNFADESGEIRWGEKYLPYSLVAENQVVANVSASIMQFDCGGYTSNYIQIGTVMTDTAYQNQGLSRFLIERIFEEYEEDVDGIYLFANNSVLNFYPKFGFRPCKSFQYSFYIEGEKENNAIHIPTSDVLKKLKNHVLNRVSQGPFDMIDNPDLIEYHIQSMENNIYYAADFNAYIAAEVNGNHLLIHQIFSNQVVDVRKIALQFGKTFEKVTLGYTPFEKEKFNRKEIFEKNTTLFVKGRGLETFENELKMFPLFSRT